MAWDDDGPSDDYPEGELPTQRQAIDAQIAAWEELSIKAKAQLDLLHAQREQIALRLVRKVIRLPKQRPAESVPLPAVHSVSYGASVVVASAASVDVMSRQPTASEIIASGVLAQQSGREYTWEHRHHPLRDGRFDSEIHVLEFSGDTLRVRPVYPAAKQEPFSTAEEARAFNVELARWYYSVNAPSPSSPIMPSKQSEQG